MALFMRIKRQAYEQPADCFEVDVKRSRIDNKKAIFQYVGSHDGHTMAFSVDNLEEEPVRCGKKELELRSSKATIHDETVVTHCDVEFKTVKRPPEFDELIASSDVPVKRARLIDITPPDPMQDNYAKLFNTLNLNDPSVDSHDNHASISPEPDCVYDIYKWLRDPTAETFSNGAINDDHPFQHECCFLSDSESISQDFCYDDDEDSNSESHWRNDYPDERSTSDDEHDDSSRDDERSERSDSDW